MAPPQGETEAVLPAVAASPSSSPPSPSEIPRTATTAASASATIPALTPFESEEALSSFSTILKYRTVSATAASDGSYAKCASYLLSRLRSVECLDSVSYLEESPDESPVVVARWKGRDEKLPVLLLNSHYDVVPALEEDWTVKPFKGTRMDGKVWGRGAQDMKCVCVQYIEAIRKLSTSKPNFRPARSIYFTFVPDEEVGGSGMAAFLSSSLYKSLPGIALALDEGLASTDSTYSVFYGERLPWWIDVTATGNTGHGSRFIEHTAVEQIVDLAKKALAFREGQRAALHGSDGSADHSNCSHAVAAKRRRLAKQKDGNGGMSLGDVTTVNVTTLEAGVKVADTYAYNCVPPVAKCSLDVRISPHVDPKDMKDTIDGWCKECSASPDDGHEVTWKLLEDGPMKHALTSTDPIVNPWYGIFEAAMTKMGASVRPEVFPAATDSRFLRALGVRALGFSPMRNTEILLHENDEYLEESVFLEGIGVYVGLLETLGGAKGDLDERAASAEERLRCEATRAD